MGADGGVGIPKEAFLGVLRAHGVTCSDHPKAPGKTICARGDLVEVQAFRDMVGRHLIGRYSAKFEIPPAVFWSAVPPHLRAV